MCTKTTQKLDWVFILKHLYLLFEFHPCIQCVLITSNLQYPPPSSPKSTTSPQLHVLFFNPLSQFSAVIQFPQYRSDCNTFQIPVFIF